MSESFDVIVVGARCAGSTLATLLARDGRRVCLVDRDRFPSDTLSTHGIQPRGVEVLERLGVLDSLLELAPPIRHLRMIFDEAEAEPVDIEQVTGSPGLGVRRVALDEVLIGAAAGSGAEVRLETAVTGLVVERSRVAGVETRAGPIRAPLVVGADGARSTVAKLVGAREHHVTANGRVFMWAYYDGDPTGGEMWIGKRGDHTYLSLPTDGGLTLVGACPSIDRRDEVRADREAVYEAGLRAWPKLRDALTGSSRDGSLRTMAKMHGFFRRSAGPGWVLVGDAGHFKDPTPGQGIGDALCQAEDLAAAIGTALDGDPSRTDAVLRGWWRRRDEDAWEMYWLANDMGAAGPTPPLRHEMERRLAAEPELTADMIRILNRDKLPSEVFTPALSLSTMSAALRRGRGRRRAILREAGAEAASQVRQRRAAPRG